MIAVDVLTAYVICGSGALVGAAMLRYAVSSQRQSAAALRQCALAFLVLGLGLSQVAFAGPEPGAGSQLAMAIGTLVCLVLVAAGLGSMAGRPLPTPLQPALLAAAVAVPVTALAFGVPALVRAFAVALAALSLLSLVLVRGYLLAPPNPAARMIGLLVLALAVSCAARAVWSMAWNGPPLSHMLHVPTALQPVYALFYGVLPMLVATLLVDTVNAQLREELHDRATFDELTGVLTRRAVRERAVHRLAEARRGRREAAVMMIDLDHFKTVNDRHGHAVGDTVLREAARALQHPLRQDALLARYGGEEFVAIVPVQDRHAARVVAERLRAAVAQTPWPALTPLRAPMTASVGVAMVGADDALDEALQRADAALYRAKREGRNRVCIDGVAGDDGEATPPAAAASPSPRAFALTVAEDA